MAVPKNTRTSTPTTSPTLQQLIQQVFRKHNHPEVERDWQRAVRPGQTSQATMRFPLYEHLYLLNLHAQKLIDLLQEVGSKFGVENDEWPLLQILVQETRASASHCIVARMSDIEMTEGWLFEQLRRLEQTRLREPGGGESLAKEPAGQEPGASSSRSKGRSK
jgi:hypothetical protein